MNADKSDNLAHFVADCLKAADKAESRSTTLSAFGVISVLLGFAFTGIWVLSVDTKDDQTLLQHAASVPWVLGTLASFILTATVLFAAASIVEIAGKRLRLELIATTDRRSANACRSIRVAAAADPESATLNAIIDDLVGTVRPQKPLTEWFFASGPFKLIARHNGQLLACNPDFIGKLTVTSPAGYNVDGSGNIVGVVIGPHLFTGVRPAGSASRLLVGLDATRFADQVLVPT